MTDVQLTGAQRELADAPGSRYVEACPGAGKTRAIVVRFLRRSQEEPRKGVALLSFTNAAADEVTRRCGATTSLLRCPNYVGTFDSFLNRFLVGPEYASYMKRRPRFIDTWNSQSVTEVKLSRQTQHHLSFRLEWFDIDFAHRTATLNQSRVTGTYAQARLSHYAEGPDAINRVAWEKWKNRVLERGFISSSASRVLFTHFLASKPAFRSRALSFLASRFVEVIVDEVQDCGAEDLALLELVAEAGLDLIMVGDPDQGIYEFREAVPDAVQKFGETLGLGQRLSDNFRSTPAICDLNRSLRAGTASDAAKGDHADLVTPVLVMTYSTPGDVASKVAEVAPLHGVALTDCIILSHRQKDAEACAGSDSSSYSGNKKAMHVARSWAILTNGRSSPHKRKQALEVIKLALLSLVNGADVDDATPEALCEQFGIPVREFEAQALRFGLAIDPRSYDKDSYASKLRELASAVTWPQSLQIKPAGNVFRSPEEQEWDSLGFSEEKSHVRCGTIHSVKGLEFPLVTLVIPHNLQRDDQSLDVLDHWSSGINSEARRVLYVGASRARQVLILAVHKEQSQRVLSKLDSDEVPYALV